MSEPKLHHYVPRFHLSRFVNQDGQFWVFDKKENKIFSASPTGVAAEKYFYTLPEFNDTEVDPLFLEKKFALLESEASKITSCWLNQIEINNIIEIPTINREIMSDFIALQFFRTSDHRETLKLIIEKSRKENLTKDETRTLHAMILEKIFRNEGIISDFSEKIQNSYWIFGKNVTSIPFITSDTPVLMKTADNKIWWKEPGLFDLGNYVVFALTPNIILYCYEKSYYKQLKIVDNHVSPVKFNQEMVNLENVGHSGLSRRFIFSPINDFKNVIEYISNPSNFDLTKYKS
jgi:hypothetical protein